jgi:adenosylmethionine-8-amino-7-oxononanoate aminotransferase
MDANTKEKLKLGKTTEELIELAKKYTWYPWNDPSRYDQPLAIRIAEDGNYFTDVEGACYLEANSGNTSCTLGHSNSYIIDAIIEELRQNPINITASAATPKQILLSQKIAERVPGNLNRVYYGLGGSDANETALKMARQYWKIKGQGSKYKIISRWWSYHGAHMASGAASGQPVRRVSFEPLPSGFLHMNPPFCYHCPYELTHPDCDLKCADELRHIIESEHRSTVAAWIGDLVITALGPAPAPPGYPQRIREICDEYNVLMIVDEVITGWGRMGTWTASEYYGVVPDIITLAKGLSASYQPLSATVVKDEIADVFVGKNLFAQMYTMGGHPLSIAAGLATIGYLEKEDVLKRVREKATWFKSELKKLEEDFRCIGTTYSIGLLGGPIIVKDKAKREMFSDYSEVSSIIRGVGLKNGVSFSFLRPRTFIIAPVLNATDQELQKILDVLRDALTEVDRRLI